MKRLLVLFLLVSMSLSAATTAEMLVDINASKQAIKTRIASCGVNMSTMILASYSAAVASLSEVSEHRFTMVGNTITAYNPIGTFTIPATINGVAVTKIGAAWPIPVFSKSKMIGKRLVLTEGLITVGEASFQGAGISGILFIPDSVTSIERYAFGYYPDTYDMSRNQISSLTIGTGLLTVGACAFYGNSNLAGGLLIPNNVTTIAPAAFAYCSALTSVSLGSGMSTIEGSAGAGVFYSCVLLKVIRLGVSISAVQVDAFKTCPITTIVIPANVTIESTSTTMGTNAGFKTFYDNPAGNNKAAGTFVYTNSAWSTVANASGAITLKDGNFSRTEITNIFTALPDRSATTNLTITVTGAVGAGALTAGDLLIATAKNWTVAN